MTFVQKYYEELFLFSLENAYDDGLISHDDEFLTYVKSKQDISNFYVMNLSVLADSMEDIYYDMNDVYYSNKVDYALGSDLDEIGRIIGCTRPAATKASVELTFTTEVYDTVKTIPSGIQVSTLGGTKYQTIQSADLPVGAAEINIQAEAVEAGLDSRVLAGTLVKIDSDAIEEIIGVTLKTVTNTAGSSGGVNAYTDEEYRELLLDWRKENIRGSKEAYEYFFANYDGINSYKLIPNWNVTGSLKVVLDPGTPYQLNDVYEKLQATVTQFPEDISMFAPEPLPIDIYAVCNVDIDLINPYSSVEKEAIKARIIDAIKLYINGDVKNYSGLGIGEDFIPYQLGVFIHEQVPELKNINFLQYTNSGVVPAEPVTITDEQKGVANDITIEME